MKDKIISFRDLEVWQLGKLIVVEIYTTTKTFPPEEIYCLTNQMRRAAVSIPSNIAEGFSRYHNKEYRQLLFVALGSCAELETQIEIACELGYLDTSSRQSLLEKLDHESRMLRNLIKKL
ncbi:MAG: four helix bundle protein [Candidatus Aureabacteria bacterium]|nr:four helix bundle protein [Candidatus Auribacterota bacterium]